MRKFFSIITLIAGIFVVGAAHAECTSDQYAVGDSCYSCPANATCDGVNFNCDDGFYRNVAVCSACPPNSTCTSPTEFTCNVGLYLKDGVCAICPGNATCAGGTETFQCNSGYYKYTNTCLSCDGHVCDGETLVSCGAGYRYSDYICKVCPATFYCPAGSSTASYRCIEGYYKADGCIKCSNEYYCPFGESTSNNYKQFCAHGYYKSGAECVVCPNGIECPGGKPENMTCTDGLFLHSNGQCLPYTERDAGTPGHCNPGFYGDENATECNACPENSTCTSATNFLCMAGYYKNDNACSLCPANATCPAGSTQINCLDGYWLDHGQCWKCTWDSNERNETIAFYCNNNTKYPCPAYVDGSLDSVLPANHSVIQVNGNAVAWTPSGLFVKATDCYIQNRIVFSAPEGIYAKTHPFYQYNGIYGEGYNRSPDQWISAANGYYLSNVFILHGYIYYKNNLPCTNKPENSYYTPVHRTVIIVPGYVTMGITVMATLARCAPMV